MKGTLQQISAERVAATQNGATGTDFVSHPLPITSPPQSDPHPLPLSPPTLAEAVGPHRVPRVGDTSPPPLSKVLLRSLSLGGWSEWHRGG